MSQTTINQILIHERELAAIPLSTTSYKYINYDDAKRAKLIKDRLLYWKKKLMKEMINPPGPPPLLIINS